MTDRSAEKGALHEAIAEVFQDHAPANTAGMVGHARPHFWGCTCGTFGHGEQGHRQHLIDALASATPDAVLKARIAKHKPILARLSEQEERVSFLGSDEDAARFVAAVSWPLERVENRDSWALRLLREEDMLNREGWQARARLQAAIDRCRAAIADVAFCPGQEGQ